MAGRFLVKKASRCCFVCFVVSAAWKKFPQELRACNDDRTDRDLQLDGGGISDQPVIISVHPLAQVGSRVGSRK